MKPRIIRFREELAALDPDTILVTGGWGDSWTVEEISTTSDVASFLPSVVIATGDQVRAARQALETTDDLRDLPLHRTEAGYPNCSTCDGGGCPDCTDPA